MEVESVSGKRKKKACGISIVIFTILTIICFIIVVVGVGAGLAVYFLLINDVLNIFGGTTFGLSGELTRGGRRDVSDVDTVYAGAFEDTSVPWRKKTEIINGNFDITITKDPWILLFLDTSLEGYEMVKGIFTAKELNSVYATSTSSSKASLGTLEIDDSNGTATMKNIMFDKLLKDLGMSGDDAEFYGKFDGMMLRYSNPDVDGDGGMDIDQNNLPWFDIRIASEFDFGDATTNNYVTDYVKKKFDLPMDGIEMTFRNYGINLIFRELFNSNLKSIYSQGINAEKIFLSWSDGGGKNVTWKTENGDDDGVCETDNGIGCRLGDLNSQIGHGAYGKQDFSVFFESNSWHEHPSGTFTYELFEGKTDTTPVETIEFRNIGALEDSQIVDGYVFPFYTFTTDSSGYITGHNYKWKKYDADNLKFVDPRSKELELLIGSAEANVAWGAGEDGVGGWCNFNAKDVSYALSGSCSYSGNDKVKLEDITYTYMSFTTINGITFRVTIRDEPCC